MLDIDSGFDWDNATGLSREDTYQVALGWFAELPEKLRWNPEDGEGRWIYDPTAPRRRTESCIKILSSDPHFYVSETTLISDAFFQIECFFHPTEKSVWRDNSALKFTLELEKPLPGEGLEKSYFENDEIVMGFHDVKVDEAFRNQGISKKMLGSAAHLAVINNNRKIVCNPGEMGSFVWTHLGGVPLEINFFSSGKILGQLFLAIDHLRGRKEELWNAGDAEGAALAASHMEWVDSKTKVERILPDTVMQLAASPIMIGGQPLGLFALKDTDLSYTIFDMQRPALRTIFAEKGVADLDALAKCVKALRPLQSPNPNSQLTGFRR